MRYLFFLLALAAFGCSNADESKEKKEDTATIGVDSTRVGNDSGILRKLP